ncbi:MAG: GNAT family N-acetyltransferase [Myxococcota bacterium]|nr:GNAT family N-acetyltransferase [Myxococcota bacterium]
MPADARAARSLLLRAPAFNAYLLALVDKGALGHDEVAGPIVGYWRGGELEGICVLGSNLVISEPVSEEAIETFADYARRSRAAFWVAVGEDTTIDRFMNLYGRQARDIRVERGGQVLFRMTESPQVPEATAETGVVRPAELEDLGVLLRTDRAMVSEELGFDPFESVARAYREGWLRRIREGRCWVIGPTGGPLSFKMDQSATSGDVVQLAGIYTAPSARRRGLAVLGVTSVCATLLQSAEMVTLYVDSANIPAVRLYEKLGFVASGFIRSVWFEI